MSSRTEQISSKVPAITLGFWIIKIICTTLGETGGDAVTMTLNLGYLVGTAIFFSLLIVLIVMQIKAKKFHLALYWATIIASTTAGTTLADYADRSLGIGYTGGSLLLLGCLLATLGIWYWTYGSISVDTIDTPKKEAFYWIAITFSQTLGTALGDWMADTNGLGYARASLIFGAGLLLLAFLYYRTKISRVWLFWTAFILTRPLGATLGDFLDKPIAQGGLNFSRPLASLILFVLAVILIYFLPQKAGNHPTKA
jgi:uncharacterized membrane-anchored protein